MKILLKGEWLSFNVVTHDTEIKFKGSYKNESYIANTIAEIVDYFSLPRVDMIEDVFMDAYND